MTKNNHEIVICGAGMIGLTFALLMAKKKIRVCIIEKNSKKNLFEQKDSRTTAISQGSYRIYKEIDIWDKISLKVQQIDQILVAEGLGPNDLNFNHKNLNEGPLGYIVENKIIRHLLLKEVLKSKYITFMENNEVSEIQNEDVNASLIKTSKKSLFYKLLVAADGRFSNTRYHANIKYFFHDYKQNAFVFNICHEEKHNGIALERFFPTGPMALLPMKSTKENKSSVVWTVDSSISNRENFKKNFDEEFKLRYDNFFGKIKNISKVKSYPLNVYSCYDYFKKNIVLIGDACQAIHPIAGQGFNLGLRDAKCLAEIIEEFKGLGLEPNSSNLFKFYENKRQIDKNLLVFSTHNLNKLFSSSGKISSILRKIGLKIFSKSSLLKKKSMLFAMGLTNFEI